jgi:replicative DNA helicase
MGVKYFILDTFKAGYDAKDEAIWLSMMNDMRKLYDTIKPSVKNVHLWCTLQLSKGTIRQRYLTQDNIGMSKNTVDVASTLLLIRRIRDDEYSGEKNELDVYKLEGKNGKTKIPVKLNKEKHYMIIFIDKNREGEAQDFQIVVEIDLGKNTYKEVGICRVPQDF